MLSEESSQPVALTPTRLVAARLLVMLLLGMIFAALFGDFVVWAVYGTRSILSARFHKLEPVFLGFSVVLLYYFMGQACVLWKQNKAHLALLEFVTFLAGGMPAGLLCASLCRLFAAKGAAVLMHPRIALLAALLLLILTFKCKAFSDIWQIVQPAFKVQDERRIIISK